MKIFHVITGLGTGGAERALCRLLETLRPPEFEHVVVSLTGRSDQSARAEGACVRLVHLNASPGKPGPLTLWRLRRLMQEERPNLVHGWMYHANLAAYLSNKENTPILWSIRHSLHDISGEKVLTRLVIRACAFYSCKIDRILFNSETSEEQHRAIGYEDDRSRVIPNGFDLSVFKPDAVARKSIREKLRISESDFVVGHVARWHPVKNHALLLEAAEVFLRTHRQSVFVLAGQGVDPANPTLTSMLKELGIGSRVRLCGPLDETAKFYTAFDIATLSSRSEAFPNTIGEAMACGVPCVAVDVGEVRAIIGNTGIVVPGSGPNPLASAWEKMATMSPETRIEWGYRARAQIETHYNLSTVASKYATLYREFFAGATA